MLAPNVVDDKCSCLVLVIDEVDGCVAVIVKLDVYICVGVNITLCNVHG